MGATDPLYVLGSSAPVVLERERAQTSSVAVEQAGEAVAIVSGTYALTGRSAAVSKSVAAGATAEVSLSALDLPSTLGYGEGYREEWVLTLTGGAVRKLRRNAVIGRFALSPPLRITDIVDGEYPDLRENFGGYVASLATMMDGAWEECLRALWRIGVPATVVVEPSDVYDWYRHVALARVFKAFVSVDANERFQRLWEYHEGKAASAKDGLRVTIDSPASSGTATATAGTGVVHPNRVGGGARGWL